MMISQRYYRLPVSLLLCYQVLNFTANLCGCNALMLSSAARNGRCNSVRSPMGCNDNVGSHTSAFLASYHRKKRQQYGRQEHEKKKCGCHRHHRSSLYMRDTSMSYWFTVGDQVQVTKDVFMTTTNQNDGDNRNRINLRHRIGIVLETWEKCDVDPTCCCAEQVDTNMSVYVQLRSDVDPNKDVTTNVRYYFSEDELMKINPLEDRNEVESSHNNNNNNNVPFNGFSCVAFKSNLIKQNQQQPRRIASYDPNEISTI